MLTKIMINNKHAFSKNVSKNLHIKKLLKIKPETGILCPENKKHFHGTIF